MVPRGKFIALATNLKKNRDIKNKPQTNKHKELVNITVEILEIEKLYGESMQ
jgi:hypothetical protein